LFILLVVDVCKTSRDFMRLVVIAVIGQIGPVFLAVANTFDWFPYLHFVYDKNTYWHNTNIASDRGVIWSSLGNPNYYANYGAILLLWLLTLTTLYKRWLTRCAIIVYSVLVIYTLLYTYTRGIWASLLPVFGIITMLLFYRQWVGRFNLSEIIHQYWKRAILAIIGLVVILSSVFALETNTGPIHKVGKRFYHAATLRDASLRSRPLLWYAALRMWSEKPVIGQGIGQYQPLYLDTIYQSALDTDPERIQHITREMNTTRSDRAHNDYLHILAEQGIIGYALFILFLLTIGFPALRSLLYDHRSRRDLVLLTGCIAVVLMVIIQCIYDFPLLLPASSILFALAAGGIIVLTRQPAKPSKMWISWKILVSLILSPILIISLGMALSHLCASHYTHKGIYHLNLFEKSNNKRMNTDFQNSEKYLSRANQLFPQSGLILFQQGRLFAHRSGRYQTRAIDYLERSMQTYSTPETYHLLCILYLDKAYYSKARKMADTLLLIDPNREEVNYLAGNVALKLHKYEEAVEYLKEELRVNFSNTRALSLLGSIYKDYYKQLDIAAATYETLLKIEPRSIDTHESLADVLVELGESDGARHHYTIALEGANALSDLQRIKRLEMKLDRLNDAVDELKE
jgi:O-Antigen ligase